MGRKRIMLICFIIIMMVGGTVACSNAKESGSAAGTPTATNQAVDATKETGKPSTEAKTRSYKHMSGTSEIPVKPERVVTDWYYGQLVALGLKPVGTDDYVLKNHPFIKKDGTESIGQSLEKIVELQPDLIISWGASKYDNFSKIAPTVPLELSGGPKDSVRIFGDILGRKAEAEQWITQFDAKVETARKKVSSKINKDETFTIFNIWKNKLRVYGFVNMGGYALYEGLQVTPAPNVDKEFRNAKEWYREISYEVLPEFAGDHIILTTYDPDGTSTVLKELESSPLWKNLKAVKNGNVHVVNYNYLYNDDPIAVENQIDILADAILAGR
ncbi:ABC transporter substrate-binding protein [Paenibacillus qinlingensis]|uniref:ABC transporter substrate-binding protein n=1 Tax=Paenibacillus qinlingensis TaxID=1837343 RepID=UPI001565DF1E|nr:ABC transporter substrate-binding protein [Paenibacillus qinlingensis]NQX61750.1 ABC transporter substrate-binding protein [Paenibacillus qinlingensis]